MPPNRTLQIPSARRISDILLVIIMTLITLSMLGQASKYFWGHPQLKGFVPTFYVDYESTIPTWYSSAALGMAGLLLGLIAVVKLNALEKYRFHWLALSGIFFLLSADEIAMLHELPIDPMRNAFQTGGMLYYPWVIPAAVLVGLVGLSYLPFVWQLPTRIRALVVLAGLTFLSGALGVEMLSGAQADMWGEENLTYAMIITLEEFLEMLGVVIFIKALLMYIENHLGGLQIQFARPATAQ
jgi:hypothetical protein